VSKRKEDFAVMMDDTSNMDPYTKEWYLEDWAAILQ
jgi:hypothetical protein